MAGEARGPLAFGGLSVPRPRREAARAWGVGSLVWGTRIPPVRGGGHPRAPHTQEERVATARGKNRAAGQGVRELAHRTATRPLTRAQLGFASANRFLLA